MDFFDHQERARKNTGRLVVLFSLAVFATVLATHFFLVLCMYFFEIYMHENLVEARFGEWYFQWDLFAYVAFVVVLLICSGSVYKIQQLAGGGHVVARGVGGTLICPNTNDPQERRLLNVVEEMAIASGMPVPPVFVLSREKGINAFAAGFTPSDAVIGVTQGCLENLSRDQLQGVMAHEFSHILNGDMRLNIRLMGVVHGILVIGIIGYFLVRIAIEATWYSSWDDEKKGGPWPFAVFGFALVIVGFIGTLFGTLIKAAVSRQREYLADASAVQFTRNPDGLATALTTIGGYTKGSDLKHPNAMETSHMFFCNALSSRLAGMFATHPPIDKRLARIDKYWKQRKAELVQTKGAMAAKSDGRIANLAGDAAPAAPTPTRGTTAAAPPSPTTSIESTPLVKQVGMLTPQHVSYAHDLIERIPAALQSSAHEPHGARAVIFSLLFDRADSEAHQLQMNYLEANAEADVVAETKKLLPHAESLPAEARLPLIEVTMGTLRQLTPSQFKPFIHHVRKLIQADEKIDLFEWTLHRMVIHHLSPEGTKPHARKTTIYAYDDVREAVGILISTLAYIGAGKDNTAAARAFGKARPYIAGVSLLPKASCGLKPMDAALNDLAEASAPIKRRLITAAAACICADKKVTTQEAELLRVIAVSLDCPMPLLLPGQPIV